MNRSNRSRRMIQPNHRVVNESTYKNLSRVVTRVPVEYLSKIDALPGSRYSVARMLIIEGLKAYEARQTPRH